MVDNKVKAMAAMIFGIAWFLTLLIICMTIFGCAQPQNGSTGMPGQSVTGPRGDRGDKGDSGSVGDPGPSGRDGSIATVVALCPGAPVYGHVYLEVGLCINNQLYGVYSANGGFMTLLTPGVYRSDAIGSACNLTVLPNCKVVN